MNKSAVVVLVALAIGAGGILWKTRSGADKPENGATSETQRSRPELPHDRRAQSGEPETFLQHDLVNSLRLAIASKDQATIAKAFEELVAFIQAHPELAEEYLNALRAEPEEQLLRGLAKALQRSEALMGSDAFIKSIVEIAQQPGFEQRQHIMLDTLAGVGSIKPELFDAIKKISESPDQPSQVRASAVAVYADWMQKFPEQSSMVIDELGRSLKETSDENVRALSVQLLALHRDKLTAEIQSDLLQRLKVEPEAIGRNLISSALFAASPEIRQDALNYLQNLYSSETDLARRRLTLAQMVMLSPMEMRAMLEQIARGDSELAEDAKEYLVLVNTTKVTPEIIMGGLVVLAGNEAGHEHSAGCTH